MIKLWFVPSAVIVVGCLVGPLGVQLGALEPEAGFALMFLAVVFAVLALPITAGAAAFASSTGRSWRGAALRAAVVPLLVVGGVVLPNARKLDPRIHDITTDPADSLQFSPSVGVEDDRMGPFTREEILELQREAYPELMPLRLEQPAAEVFERALATAREMPGWEVTRSDPSAQRIEAEATSRIFRFIDDIVIRIQADPEGATRVDVRSRSRVGQSDLGANAARIRTYLSALER